MTESLKVSTFSPGCGVVQLWRRHWQWAAMAAIAAAAVVLGYIGLTRYFAAAGQTRSIWDICYSLLSLFVIESGEVSGPVPWQLAVARLLAPVVPAWAIVKAVAVVFHDQLQSLRLRFASGHVVVCGLGRKGLQLVEDFRHQGERVVAIEKDARNDAVRICREWGVPVLVGDATDKALLRKAGLPRAKHIIAICGDDGANVEIAVHCFQLVQEEDRAHLPAARCFLHLVDLKLCVLLRSHRLFAETGDPIEVKVFNTYENGARLLWENYPLDRVPITPEDPRVVHLIVIGLGRMGQSVALQAARLAHYANGKRLRITAIDAEADLRRMSFAGSYPQFERVCDITYVPADADDPRAFACIRAAAENSQEITSVVVCLDDDSRCLSCGLSVLSRLKECSIPIYVRLSEESGLATLLGDEASSSGWATTLRPFGMTNLTCRRKILLDDDLDLLARTIHAYYVEERLREGKSPMKPSMQPWERLDPDYRESSRQQADHIDVKLRAIGYFSSATPVDRPVKTGFPSEKLELLARTEHARWVAERLLAGWTLGPRDIAKKTSPHLCPWEELTEDVKEYDYQAVRIIPLLLERIGQKVYQRIPGTSANGSASSPTTC